MEKMFILELLRRRRLPIRNIFIYIVIGTLRCLHGEGVDAFKRNKSYLRKLPKSMIQLTAGHLVEKKVIPRLAEGGLSTIRSYRNQGYRILLMSGSPDFLTHLLATHLGADYTVSTVIEVQGDCFTGRLVGLHPYGKGKTQLLAGLQPHLDLDFENSVVFANHHSDADHLARFGKSVAVNPTPELRKIAKERGWAIESWIRRN
jgi:HAD superfamily phosphoserine phosphatase-like hydrolase